MKKNFKKLSKSKKITLFNKRVFLNIFLIFFALQITVFSSFFGIFSYDAFLAKIISGTLVDLTNIERSFSSINQLTTNPLLEKAAELKARDMAEKGYFAHTSPEGITPWYWFKEVGYDFNYAGENLAVNFTNSNSLHQAWLNSATHRKNILNDNFTEIGIGIAEGIYKGKKAVFVVQLFGSSKEGVLLASDFNDYKELETIASTENGKALEKTEVLGESEEVEKTNSYITFKSELEEEEEEIIVLGMSEKESQPLFLSGIFDISKIIILFFSLILIIFICFSLFNFFRKEKLNNISCFVNSVITVLIIFLSILINYWFFSLVSYTF